MNLNLLENKHNHILIVYTNMETKNYIKSILKLNAVTIKRMAELLNEKSDKKYTQNSLSLKINNNRLTLQEASLIAEILGYELEFVRK